jgi:hypothetical protein
MAFHARSLRLVGDAASAAQEHAGSTAQAAAERIEDAAGEIARYARTATECLEEWGKDARDSMERAPVMWSVLTLGAIALVGLGATLVTRNRMERDRRKSRAAAQLRSRKAARSPSRAAARGNSAGATP